MAARQLAICLLAVYLTAFVVILVGTEPWNSGEGAIAWTLLMVLLSAPSGILVIAAQTMATVAWGDLAWFKQVMQLPVGAATMTAAYAALGALQWFVLLPYLVRQMKRLVSRFRS